MSEKQELTVAFEVDGYPVKLTPSIVEKFITGNNTKITMAEFKFFTELCKVRGLNPFLREAYLVKYGNEPAQLIVGQDAVYKKAILHPQFNGVESGIIVQNEKTGEITERKGGFYLENETVLGGWAKVWRKDWSYPIYKAVPFNEVAKKKKDGTYNQFWGKQPALMCEKVAKTRAMPEAFIEVIGAASEADEQFDDPIVYTASSNAIIEQDGEIIDVAEEELPI